MKKIIMPKSRKQFEEMLIDAFDNGMQAGYSVEHTEKSNDEEILRDRFLAVIQGKSDSLFTVIDGKTINIERW